jgi:hypothetical protein
MRCYDCKYWGDGDGTGQPYDAGHVNYCKNPLVSGPQHPSHCDARYASQIIAHDGEHRMLQDQHIMTRGRFGCVLFEIRTK